LLTAKGDLERTISHPVIEFLANEKSTKKQQQNHFFLALLLHFEIHFEEINSSLRGKF
jgi:hypothetical protein